MYKNSFNEIKEDLKVIPFTEIKEESLVTTKRVSTQLDRSSDETPRWESTGLLKEIEGLKKVFSEDVVKCLYDRFYC